MSAWGRTVREGSVSRKVIRIRKRDRNGKKERRNKR